MFYSVSILSKKNGSLGYIWCVLCVPLRAQPQYSQSFSSPSRIAANFDSTSRMGLTRREINKVDVLQSCQDIINPYAPLALRLSALLMVGVIRVHLKQTHYVYMDAKDAWKRLERAFQAGSTTAIDLTAPAVTRKDALTLPDPLDQDASYLALMLPWNLQNQLPNAPHDSQYFSIREDPSYDSKDVQQESPFVANPKDISMHEEHTTPIETLQKQVEHPEVEAGFGEESILFMDEVPITSEIPLPLVIDVGVCGATLDDPVILFDERAECFKPHYNTEATPTSPALRTPPQNKPQDGAGFCTPLVGQQHMDEGEGLQALPKRSRKPRRRLVFDQDIGMPRDKLRQNLMTGDSTCLPVDLTALKQSPAKVLLSQPTCTTSIRNNAFVSIWERCAVKVTGVVGMNTEPAGTTKTPSNDPMGSAHNPSESVGSEVEALRGVQQGEQSYNEASGHSMALQSSDTSENQSYDHMDSSSAHLHRTDSSKPSHPPLPRVAGLSPIMDADQEMDPMSMHIDFACDLSGSFNANTSMTIETERNSFLSHVTRTIGARSEFEFQDLLPEICSRKIASKMFSQTLELISRGMLEPRQNKPYGPIVLSRGEAF